MRKVITVVLEYVIANKEALAEKKFSGVHLTDLGYRFHLSSVMPAVINVDWNIVGEVVAESFPDVKWDSQTLWFTL